MYICGVVKEAKAIKAVLTQINSQTNKALAVDVDAIDLSEWQGLIQQLRERGIARASKRSIYPGAEISLIYLFTNGKFQLKRDSLYLMDRQMEHGNGLAQMLQEANGGETLAFLMAYRERGSYGYRYLLPLIREPQNKASALAVVLSNRSKCDLYFRSPNTPYLSGTESSTIDSSFASVPTTNPAELLNILSGAFRSTPSDSRLPHNPQLFEFSETYRLQHFTSEQPFSRAIKS